MPRTGPSLLSEVTITESRPSEFLAVLHESAHGEREYLFANRDAGPDDLVLVAWLDGEAVGYIAVTDERSDGVLVWEHLVVPAHRGEGLGARLLREAAKRAVPGAVVVVDPLGDLDRQRIADYYQRLGFGHDSAGGGIWATASEVLRATRPDYGGADENALSVGALLESKAPGVVTVAPDCAVGEVVSLLSRLGIGAVVISTDGSRVEGICAERDILIALDRRGVDIMDTPVIDISPSDVVTCTAGDTVVDVMELMTRNRVRQVPVTNTGRLVGLVSLGDVVFNRLADMTAPAAMTAASKPAVET